MNFDDLQALEKQIALKRGEREMHNQQAVQAKQKAKALSAEIRALEAKLPPPKARRAITMSVQPATVALKPKR